MRYTVWTPDVCCRSLLVSVNATFLFLLAGHRVLVILRLPCPWASESSLNCRPLTLFFFPLQTMLGATGLTSFIFNPLNFLHAFTSNSPLNMSSSMCCFVGDINHLIVILDTAQANSAIAAGLGFVSITALIIISVALCLTRKYRGQAREKRGSVTTPVIDICRERQSCVAEPHRPPEVYLSSKTASSPISSPLIEPAKAWQSSSSIRTVSKHEDELWRTGLHRPSGYVPISALDLEAQSWEPTIQKRIGKAEPSRPLSVELPISPPPSYSQIDRSVLVLVP